MRSVVLLTLIAFLLSCTSPPERPIYEPTNYSSYPFYELEMGSYPVGFKSVLYQDSSRSLGEKTPRPVLVGIWYPAELKEEGQLRYGDYVLANTERTGKSDTLIINVKDYFVGSLEQIFGIDETKSDSLFDLPVRAFDAPQIAQGKFPLMAYAASYNAGIHENSALWELAASHGYVVASIASIGYAQPAMTADSLGICAQNSDFRFALERMIEEPFVDAERLATSGFSWGAFSAILTGVEKQADAILTFDGSNNYFPQMNEAYASGYNRPFDGAYVQFNQRRTPTATRAFDSTVFDLMKAKTNSYLFMFNTMDHRDFASSFQFFNQITEDSVFVSNQERVYGTANSRAVKSEGYLKTASMMMDLLDGYLKDDEEAKRRIDQMEDDIFQINRRVIRR